MTNTKTLNAVCFEEDDGYLLVKPLAPGCNGTVMAVKSRKTQEIFLRKRVSIRILSNWLLEGDNVPPREVRVYKHMGCHPRIIPLVSWHHLGTDSTEASFSIIHPFCNGGDLSEFLRQYREAYKSVPEVFLWHLLVQIIEMLGFLHLGWRKGERLEDLDKTRLAIGHLDLHAGNILLHWPSNSAVLPDLVLADFGEYAVFPAPWVGDRCDYSHPTKPKLDDVDVCTDGNTGLRMELSYFGEILEDLLDVHDVENPWSRVPFEFREWARNLHDVREPENPTYTIADVIKDLYPVAEKHVERLLQADTAPDMCWTQRKLSTEPMLVDYSDPRSNRMLSEQSPPWTLVPVLVPDDTYNRVCEAERPSKWTFEEDPEASSELDDDLERLRL